MKIQLSPHLLSQHQLWSMAILVGLVALQLYLSLHYTDADNIGIQLLGWVVIFVLLWQKRQQFHYGSDPLSSIVGLFLIAVFLLKSSALTGEYSFINLAPILFSTGTILLVSGWQRAWQYWRELLIMLCVCGPDQFIHVFLNIAPLTAKAASYLMWYGGLKVINRGVFIYLPTGTVEVDAGCDGSSAIAHLLGLSLIFLMLFSIKGAQQYIAPIVAMVLAFVVNAIRVILMALLVADQQTEAFHYWHTGDGSNLFSLIAVLLFGGYCYWVLNQIPPSAPNPTP